MGPTTTHWITRIGVVGHLARMVAFGLIGIFVAEGRDRLRTPRRPSAWTARSRKLARQTYGTFLLAVVAAGLIAFGIYSIADARYRRI